LRVAALVTSGKDSALALYRAVERGYEVAYLVTMIPQREDSWMFHYPNIHLADLFAEAVGISHVKTETAGIKEAEVEDLKRLLATLDIDAVVSGAISSEYQKKRIDKVCSQLGLKSIAPLWHQDPRKLLDELIKLQIETIIVGVYAYGFTADWLGRKINQAAINDLLELNKKYQISLVGEGGEYETLVLNMPFFRKKIRLAETEKIWENQSGYLLVKKAVLAEKERKKGKSKSNL
jgi:predicted ATP pyrophosphatase (TIGR00289 family)